MLGGETVSRESSKRFDFYAISEEICDALKWTFESRTVQCFFYRHISNSHLEKLEFECELPELFGTINESRWFVWLAENEMTDINESRNNVHAALNGFIGIYFPHMLEEGISNATIFLNDVVSDGNSRQAFAESRKRFNRLKRRIKKMLVYKSVTKLLDGETFENERILMTSGVAEEIGKGVLYNSGLGNPLKNW